MAVNPQRPWRGASDFIGDPELFAQALPRARRVMVRPGGAITENAPELLAPQRSGSHLLG
jgi:hypothetical protein